MKRIPYQNLPAGYSKYSSSPFEGPSILLPDRLISELNRQELLSSSDDDPMELEEPGEESADAVAAEAESAETDLSKEDSRWLPIFPQDGLQMATKELEGKARDIKLRNKLWLDRASQWNGRRQIPALERSKLISIFDDLLETFPNFKEAVRLLRSDLALNLALRPADFRVSPILLHGAPGLGKTYFAVSLAERLGVGFEKIAAGNVQGPFLFSGSSVHWHTSQPGQIFLSLANHASATPVLLIDEIDKLPQNESHPVLGALLELLEWQCSRTYKDECMGLTFDASHMIVIATANDIERIPQPLISRLSVAEVAAPTPIELKGIADKLITELNDSLPPIDRFRFSHAAVKTLSEGSDVRVMQRSIRQSAGDAVLFGKRRVRVKDLWRNPISGSTRRRIGFV
jgi:ATP-dependent Lon protease